MALRTENWLIQVVRQILAKEYNATNCHCLSFAAHALWKRQLELLCSFRERSATASHIYGHPKCRYSSCPWWLDAGGRMPHWTKTFCRGLGGKGSLCGGEIFSVYVSSYAIPFLVLLSLHPCSLVTFSTLTQTTSFIKPSLITGLEVVCPWGCVAALLFPSLYCAGALHCGIHPCRVVEPSLSVKATDDYF